MQAASFDEVVLEKETSTEPSDSTRWTGLALSGTLSLSQSSMSVCSSSSSMSSLSPSPSVFPTPRMCISPDPFPEQGSLEKINALIDVYRERFVEPLKKLSELCIKRNETRPLIESLAISNVFEKDKLNGLNGVIAAKRWLFFEACDQLIGEIQSDTAEWTSCFILENETRKTDDEQLNAELMAPMEEQLFTVGMTVATAKRQKFKRDNSPENPSHASDLLRKIVLVRRAENWLFQLELELDAIECHLAGLRTAFAADQRKKESRHEKKLRKLKESARKQQTFCNELSRTASQHLTLLEEEMKIARGAK